MDLRRRWLAIVIAFALWPAAQIHLTREHWVSPWKLMGFGMYSTIPPRHWVKLIEVVEGREIMLPGIPAALIEHYDRYSTMRASLGSLADPDALGRACLAGRPGASAVIVEVDVSALDPETARFLVMRRDRYRFPRAL